MFQLTCQTEWQNKQAVRISAFLGLLLGKAGCIDVLGDYVIGMK
jgi:hypothetical protein